MVAWHEAAQHLRSRIHANHRSDAQVGPHNAVGTRLSANDFNALLSDSGPSPMPIAPLLPGQHLNADANAPGGGRFMIEKPLSAGGFAITYLAYDQQSGDRCVIKELAIDQLMIRSGADMVPLPGRDGDVAIWVQKVEKEANTLHRLRNAGVVPIRTTWRENGTAYFAMDFIDGIELPAEPTLGAGWSTWEPVALKFLAALGAIHAEGLVHGDIKPANILVDREGNPIIIDFGTARSTEEAKKTRLTTVAMTPGYCPPELAVRDRAREMGPWSDLYSWSLTVMGLVIRHRGIDGAPLDTSARVALAQHGLAEAGMGAESASALREVGVPEPWIAVLMACVALEPSARPQSAAAVSASLQPAPVARAAAPVVAAPTPAPVAAAPAPAPVAPAPPAAAARSTAEDAASRAAAAAARYDSLSPQPKPAGSRKALVTVLAFGAVAAVGIALVVGMQPAPPAPFEAYAASGSAEFPTPAAEQAAVPAAEPVIIPPPPPVEPTPAVPEPVPAAPVEPAPVAAPAPTPYEDPYTIFQEAYRDLDDMKERIEDGPGAINAVHMDMACPDFVNCGGRNCDDVYDAAYQAATAGLNDLIYYSDANVSADLAPQVKDASKRMRAGWKKMRSAYDTLHRHCSAPVPEEDNSAFEPE